MAVTKIKTQKAKGIVHGIDHIIGYAKGGKIYRKMRNFMSQPSHIVIKNEMEAIKNKQYPCFARPCPTEPRHGFVDSRTVTTRKELMKLWKEVMKQDASGEIILGPHIKNVVSNAVYVSSGNLAIGKGNDGATGGKESISFPVAPHSFSTKILKKSGLDRGDTVYLEAILTKDKWWLTQVRGGPAIDSISPDYIPKSTKVKKVVIPHDDLLAWESEAKAFKPGTVVYGNGHTLASHAAIHCVLNKIPFVTTFEPIVGKTIKPEKATKVRKLNRTKFKRGIRAGLNMCKARTGQSNMLKFFYFSLSVLHNWAYIKHSEHADWLLGAATILFAKTCASLVHGEFRHSPNHGKLNTNRSKVYANALKNNTAVFSKLPMIFSDFHSGGWTDGFGGVPWANCTWYTYSLWTHIVKIYNKTSANLTEKEISNVISVINRTVNIAHNNGWWFNKIAEKQDMDFAANSPGLAAYCVAEFYDELYKKVQKVKTVQRKFKKTVKLETPFTRDKDGRIAWVYLDKSGSKTSLSVMFEDGKYKYKKIKLSKTELKAVKKLYDSEDKDRWQQTLLPTNASGQFKIPGGIFRDIGKVFA